MPRTFALIGLICLLFSSNGTAFERLRLQVGVSEIPYTLSQFKDKKGDYNRLLERLPELEIIFMPPARAGRMFDKKQLDCLFPASTATMVVHFDVIQSLPVSKVSAFVFSKDPYLSIDQFKGKK